MKETIRRGIFETNSSSTHSLCLCTKQQWEDWEKGKLLFDCYEDIFVEAGEAMQEQLSDAEMLYESEKEEYWKKWNDLSLEEKIKWTKNNCSRSSEYLTKEEYFSSEYLEPYCKNYTTPGGEEIVAFGRYGYDG